MERSRRCLRRPDDLRTLAARDDEESPSRDLRIAAPDREGYVVFRVFSEAPSLYAQAGADAADLADVLHGSEKNVLKVDCGEFQWNTRWRN